MLSIVLGTAGLWLALGAAAILAAREGIVSSDRDALRRLRIRLFICTCVQAGHFFEEWQTGFHRSWPVRLGLEPWSDAFFFIFNAGWLIVWVATAGLLPRGGRATRMAAWFLALAAMLNAIAHPLLALSAGGYFPGLLTSPFLGLAGYALWRALRNASETQSEIRTR